jgi:hypothetical protein
MIDECVVAVYPSIDQAHEAVQRLVDGGHPSAKISLVTVSIQTDPVVVEELSLNDDARHDAAIGAGLGSLLGLLAGLSVMVLSGVGIVFLFGPVGGSIVGSIAGGYLGSLMGYGVHQHQLERFERLVQEGNVLVIANGDPVELAQAHGLLSATEATELHTYARSENETPETA